MQKLTDRPLDDACGIALGPPSSNAPIFVAGPVRSGTTLLRWMLDSHPHIVAGSEQTFLVPFILEFYQTFLDNGFRGQFDDQKLNHIRLRSELEAPKDEIALRFRRLHSSFYEDMCKRSGKRRWADSTHGILDNLLATVDLLYDQTSRYVMSVRHGLDVVVSIHERFKSSSIQTCVDYWCNVTELHLAFRRAHPARCVLSRYEDLVTAPQKTMDSIFAFLGEESVPDICNQLFSQNHAAGAGDDKIVATTNVHTNSINRWQSVSPDLYRHAIENKPLFGQLMSVLGYSY
jgi:protein-tyrosine sulfotransferase